MPGFHRILFVKKRRVLISQKKIALSLVTRQIKSLQRLLAHKLQILITVFNFVQIQKTSTVLLLEPSDRVSALEPWSHPLGRSNDFSLCGIF